MKETELLIVTFLDKRNGESQQFFVVGCFTTDAFVLDGIKQWVEDYGFNPTVVEKIRSLESMVQINKYLKKLMKFTVTRSRLNEIVSMPDSRQRYIVFQNALEYPNEKWIPCMIFEDEETAFSFTKNIKEFKVMKGIVKDGENTPLFKDCEPLD